MPAWASSLAIAAPIPRPPPVTSATCPASSESATASEDSQMLAICLPDYVASYSSCRFVLVVPAHPQGAGVVLGAPLRRPVQQAVVRHRGLEAAGAHHVGAIHRPIGQRVSRPARASARAGFESMNQRCAAFVDQPSRPPPADDPPRHRASEIVGG